MGHCLKEVFSSEVIAARIKEISKEISVTYGDQPLVCVCVLKGAYLFFADLTRSLEAEPEIDFVRLSSYGSGTSRTGSMNFSKDLEGSIADKHVLIVEDIVDTGHSVEFLKHVFSKRNPLSIKTCALIDKGERREIDLKVDFPGFVVENGFLVGYGMDYAEKYRYLNAVYELENV
ncbi:hypoxanthine phosphoribosyltransferase [Maridesulfovibrio ferrireducens]|uniref:hypoxanthine phosphoribosyltransferase n=1 Tax=Maridesulfovibrio ferrireducens TaxID=246191 RepID=UPI001A1A6864|nr:hypoxanthine phosphoribosyltransferase [Maridesulfovibrio ferrireducens]MBI9112724.1 hypoxanthine phosphoribosyltransferase [Maridesulfovibrio ferrireducens]